MRGTAPAHGWCRRSHAGVRRARGPERGLGAQLMREPERLARARRLSTLGLDTCADLVEARRLYARLGYHEVLPFNNGHYADHWFAKSLD